jgi:hypothetical protein
MNMGSEKREVIGSLDAGMSESRVEVVVCERDGEYTVALQLSTWQEALGWQRQKTIPLAADKIGQLQRLLSHARNQIEDRGVAVGAVARVFDFALRGPESPAIHQATQPAVQDDQVKSAIN